MTKESVIKILQEALDELDLKIKSEEIENLLEVPKFTDMGDFAFPCFSLASKIKMSPQEIAQNLRAEIKKIPSGFQDIQVAGPYINFFFNRKNLSIKLVNEIIKQKNTEDRGKTLLHQKNMGIGAASNACINTATGMYILQLDSDDEMHPLAIEKLLPLIKANPKMSCIYGRHCKRKLYYLPPRRCTIHHQTLTHSRR